MRPIAFLFVLLLCAAAQGQERQTRILFTNVDVFEGTGPELIEDASVLVEADRIAAVSTGEIEADGATVIDAAGRTMIPGLTDAHVHLMMQDLPLARGMQSGLDYLSHVAARAARNMLMRGFTTVRDMGGPVFGLKQAIDEGLIPGPRIYPSGPLLGQTSGHSDFRGPLEIPAEAGTLTPHERMGFSLIGRASCRERVCQYV